MPAGEKRRSVSTSDSFQSRADDWATRLCRMKSLNRIQSRITRQHITRTRTCWCAPTGAGKTNIAMMTVLHEIGQHIEYGELAYGADFKIVYVAPMKALAAEVTGAFGRRLEPLGIQVGELTGDLRS